MMEYGFEEGERCGRKGCQGVITCHPVEGCSCHISPPCGACTTPREYCPLCGWEHADDPTYIEHINDFVCRTSEKTRVIQAWKPRELDRSRIDWHSKPHSNSSMVKEGVYPEGTTQAAVLEKVKGTFGGRFEYFGNGRFKYIAYTD